MISDIQMKYGLLLERHGKSRLFLPYHSKSSLMKEEISRGDFNVPQRSSLKIVENPCMLYLGVIGEGRADREIEHLAFRLGEAIAESKAVLVCGGLGGVMEKACQGAKSKNGTTIGILPGILKSESNPYVDYAIVTGLGEARNLVIVRTSDAVISVAGGYGTLSELAFAMKLGIPVVGIRTWDLRKRPEDPPPFPVASSPEEAVQIALKQVVKKK